MAAAMREVGYAEAYARNPQKLARSDRFKELLEEHGLTKKLIVESLVEDIKAKPQKRVEELKLAARIGGLIVNENGTGVNVQNNVLVMPSEALEKYEVSQSPIPDSQGQS